MARGPLPGFLAQPLPQGTDPDTAVVGPDQRTVREPVLQGTGLAVEHSVFDYRQSLVRLTVVPIEMSVIGTAMAITGAGAAKRPRVPVEFMQSGTRIFE